jgi:hypothetical protein
MKNLTAETRRRRENTEESTASTLEEATLLLKRAGTLGYLQNSFPAPHLSIYGKKFFQIKIC